MIKLRSFVFQLILLLGLVGIGLTGNGLAQECIYQADSFGPSFEFGTAQLFRFSDTQPEDVTANIEFKGKAQFFGQFRYGSDEGTRVAIVVDEMSTVQPPGKDTEFELYVDLNRDRILDSIEKISGSGRNRQFELDIEYSVEGELKHAARQVVVSRSTTSASFSVNTLGGCEGKFRFGDDHISVRRTDGNGNGLFGDAKDQIWLDLNSDATWSPIGERFPFQSALRLAGERYSVRGDSLGQNFRLVKIEGEGIVRLAPQFIDANTTIEQLTVSLFGHDGSTFIIKGTEPMPLPVGKYMVGSISISIVDLESPVPWYFNFSHSGLIDQRTWYSVEDKKELAIELFSKLSFDLSGPKQYTVGEKLTVRPTLVTRDGLNITSSGRGQAGRLGESEGNDAKLVAMDVSFSPFANCLSGFR